jgi:hypothetical protein
MNTKDIAKNLGIAGVILVYALTLLTQLPHIGEVYSSLERGAWQHWTAWGAALAFEASVALFTLRLILNKVGERSRWTAWGVRVFLLMSGLVNLTYYFGDGVERTWLQNAVAFILSWALPGALWLYAEEFGATVRAVIRQESKTARDDTETPTDDPQTLRMTTGVQGSPIGVSQKPADLSDSIRRIMEDVYRRLGDTPFSRQEFEELVGVKKAAASAYLQAGRRAGIVSQVDAGKVPRYQVRLQPNGGGSTE